VSNNQKISMNTLQNIHTENSVPMSSLTTLKVGGDADIVVHVTTPEELRVVIAYAQENTLPLNILGGGSNILVYDEGVRGLVVRMEIDGITYTDIDAYAVMVKVGAGVSLDTFIEETVARRLWGLENLSSIPGTVGATPIQNVGAYGVEVSDHIAEVHTIDIRTMQVRVFSKDECAFGYRTSFFKSAEGTHFVVTHVSFELTRIPHPRVRYHDLWRAFSNRDLIQSDIRKEVIAIRSTKFPDWKVIGTAGSFFKNPHISADVYHTLQERFPDMPGFDDGRGTIKVPLGWIIDKVLHMRGVSEGVVGTHHGQSLVFVNLGGATAHDIDAFAQRIEDAVREKTGLRIEREVMWYPR
jgi:UDP-N-acetylmuramate dehydrogenase